MDKLFLTVLNMSLTGAFVIAAICIVRLPLKKAPKIISYCLWAVAGFRLVFPFSIESVFSLIPFKAQIIPTDIAIQAVPRIDSGIPFVNNAVSSVLPAATAQASVNPLQFWISVGAFVWIVGVAVMLIYGVASYFILKQKMKQAAHVEANIYEAENIKSPFVLGIFKPRIYLPTALSAEERSYIVLHEQTHIRRRDHIVKFAAYFVLCLHWFNPLAWAAFLLMGVDMEQSCDERVLKEMGDEIKKEYSLSLLTLATERRFVGGSPLAFGEGGIKERIKNVLNFKKPSRVIIVASVTLVAMLGVGLALNKAGEAEKNNLDIPAEWFGNLEGKNMTFNDVRELAAKGDNLLFEDLRQYKGMNASSNFDYYIMVYVVEGGYRLVVHSKESGKPDSVNLESIWEGGGSGIDIRYGVVDEFLRANPSQDAITEEQAQNIAQTRLGVELKPVSWYILGDWPERTDNDTAFARALLDSIDAINEPCWVLRVKGTAEWGGQYYAVGKRSGNIFICNSADNGKLVWDSVAETDSGVKMIIENVDSSGISFIIDNTTKREYTYGEAYTLYVRENNSWVLVEPVIENGVFHDIGYVVLPQSKTDVIPVDWKWLYGELTSGHYRFQKGILFVRNHGDFDKFVLACEFTLP